MSAGHRRRQRKRFPVIPVLAVVGVCVIAAGAVFVMKSGLLKKEKLPTAAEEFTSYVSCLQAGDYQGMYGFLTEQSRTNISGEDFVKRNQNIYEGIEAAGIQMELGESDELNEDQELVHYRLRMDTPAGEIAYENQVTFTKNEEKRYRMEWDSNQIYPGLGTTDKIKVTTAKSRRGEIVDRNGELLAGEGIVSSVGLVPGKMSEDSAADLEKLGELLEVSVESIEKKLGASYVKADSFVPVKMVSKDAMELKEELLKIPGVMISDAKSRVYPLGKAAAHMTGYVQNISAEELEKRKGQGYSSTSQLGKSGLESIYEERLKGTDGKEIYIADSEGNKLQVLARKEPEDGDTIRLTIDSAIQRKLYEQFQGDKAASVVMNPRTGEVLALISTPAYDPNDFVFGMSKTRWDSLNEDPNQPFYNRYKAALCPGSSFKPVIAAAGMTAGRLDPAENFGRSGLSWQKDASWGNYKVTTLKEYGDQVDMKNALINSDNIYFAKAALKIGAGDLKEQLTRIGFGEPVPFEYGLTASQISGSGSFDSEIQLADSGYGQGQILVNPVHMASIYSAFVNEGNMVKPYLEYKADIAPEYWKEQAFTAGAADTVRDDLIQVVESPEGTGHEARIEGLTLAGKTGTAEIKLSKDDTAGTELGWFNAFSAGDDPKRDLKPYLVIAMVEDVKGRGGSHYVIPKVKSIFQ